jgi:tetratricopeptide (TPR) repeat protein
MDASVVAATSFKYRAFISYSHRDRKWAEWLHKAIETYRVPQPLVGRPSRDGPIPRQIFPVFRDRDELGSSADLSASICAALQDSASLIVICSPAAAKSRWVEQEIRAYKQLGRSDQIFAVIVDGEPNAATADRECFPAALRYVTRPDGSLTETRAEPVAADLRAEGDGRDDGKLKLLAGVLGVGFNDLKRRELAAARRRARIYQGIAGAMLVLALLATTGGWMAWRYARHAEGLLAEGIRISADQVAAAVRLADQSGISRKLIDALLTETEQAFQGLYRKTADAPRLPWRDDAVPVALSAEHAVLLLVFADHYGIIGDTAQQQRTADRARDILETAVNDADALPEWQMALARSHDMQGDVLAAQWQVDAALQAFRAGLAVRRSALAARPDDPGVRREVALSEIMIGDMLRRQGQWDEALSAYREALTIGQQLLQRNPEDQSLRRDVAIGGHRIGDMLMKQGDIGGAEAAYRESLALAEALVAADPDNIQAQRDLSITHDKIGGALKKAGRIDAAATAYRRALEIIKPLAAADPVNVGLQRDLAKSYEAIGALAFERHDLAVARDMLTESLRLTDAIALADRANALFQRELTVAWNRLADVHAAEGDGETALELLRRSLAVRQRLVATDQTNTQAWRDLAVSHERIGQQLMKRGLFAEAVTEFRAVVDVQGRIAADNPANAEWQREWASSLRNLGRAFDKQGEISSALAAYRQALTIREQLARLRPDDPTDRQRLVAAYMDVADAEAHNQDLRKSAEAFCQAELVVRKRALAEQDSRDWQQRRARLENKLKMAPESQFQACGV